MKKLSIYLFLTFIFFISSCNSFLDVRPDDKLYEEELFVNERGFVKAINGIYTSLITDELYKYNLKFGTLDLMVGYWTTPATDIEADDIQNFKYTNSTVQGRINSIWEGLYKGIHQTNIIIQNLSKIKDHENYGLIAGEVYGLRGFLHFELLKLFGPVIKEEGLSASAIPIYLTSEKVPQKFATAKQVIASVRKDLEEASVFLKDDPIQVIGRTGNLNSSEFGEYSALLERRGDRMNLYAAQSLLARLALWEGDQTQAYAISKKLIEEIATTQAVRFVKRSDIEGQSKKDYRFSCENIFGLYDNSAEKAHNQYFINNNYKIAYESNLEHIYEGGTGDLNDIRFQWGLGNYYFTNFNKFLVSASDQLVDLRNDNAYEIQLINLPELYLIAAEAIVDTDLQESLRLLNELRLNRQILTELTIDNADELKLAIRDEVRREYIGEGYLFNYYKRNFSQIPFSSKLVEPTLDIYKLPIPTAELIFNK